MQTAAAHTVNIPVAILASLDAIGTTLAERRDERIVRESFDVRDSKGRVIGARIRTETRVFAERAGDDDGYGSSYRIKPGTWYTLDVHATRDGSSYGALQHTRYFVTVADRDAAIAKYLGDARKRAAKLAR